MTPSLTANPTMLSPRERLASVAPGDRERGFSLIEVLVAIVLLGGIAVGIMAFVGTSMKLNRLALERTLATDLATARIEAFKSVDYLPSASHAGYALPAETVSGTAPEFTLTADYGDLADYPDFSRVVTFTYDLPVAGMMRIQVDVTWRNVAQGEKTHTMITYAHPDLERVQ